ncbi:TerD family protein [Nocardia mexicana]|uniref:Tellurium resistance protein TerZ n=1 Tax=Nocardia mexicana TaxID=279262 RepID=A0A370HCB0_9NOCA|nr:TerD family protein [Nocardia mexicana]RDI54576.1 tellurium resistance protein TerZ [Nocardia mexicana]
MLIPLHRSSGAPIDHIVMGLGWDPTHPRQRKSWWWWFGGGKTEIDLNSAALLFTGDQLVDVVYHERLGTDDGSVRHHGDSVTGEGPGDDEVISVDFTRLPEQVTTIVLLVTCYSGQTFEGIERAYCRLLDDEAGIEITRYRLPAGPYSGLVMGVLERGASGWQFRQVAEGITAAHPVDAVPLLGKYLR